MRIPLALTIEPNTLSLGVYQPKSDLIAKRYRKVNVDCIMKTLGLYQAGTGPRLTAPQ